MIGRCCALVIVAAALAWPICARSAQGKAVFAGIWSDKDDGGTGGLFFDLTWDDLKVRWKELGAGGQYLADVEAYRRDGAWRFAAAWRRGPGHGGLLLAPWPDFIKAWNDAKATQDLIDLEVINDGGQHKFLGVWRRKQNEDSGAALHVGLSWNALVAKHTELGKSRYLASIATYLDGDKRLYAGVWRPGHGNGGLYRYTDWAAFLERKKSLDKTQQMLDFKAFQSPDAKWTFIGIWRVSNQHGRLDASASEKTFLPFSATQFTERWQHRNTRASLVGLTVVNAAATLRGDTSCKPGDADCNVCANDVAAQFKADFETGHRPWLAWRDGTWSFRGSDRYPPAERKPEDAFYPHAPVEHGGPTSKHIQGLVKTNSARFLYAGSHSHKDSGSIFFIEQERGGPRLHSLHRAASAHPGGVAVLGDGLFVTDERDSVRMLSVSDAGKTQARVAVEDIGTAGGGLGLAKLHDGTTLLISSSPGDGFRKGTTDDQRKDNVKPRATRFWRLSPNAFEAKEVTPLGSIAHRLGERPETPLAYSENLSVITECGTGKIYTIHTTGDYGAYGNGWWRLSRVDDGPTLVHVALARQDQHNEKCHHRSSATVHVDAKGQLEFLCSERNVIDFNPSGKFGFKEGHR